MSEKYSLTTPPNIGNLGDIDAYITAVNAIPMLSPEREYELATALHDHEDLDAARQLVLSHLRLVVSISRQYFGYGLPQADLIQEGNIGLMKAVKRFDPNRGVRLVSFAVHWIKAEINEYVVRNWRLIKIATTKAQRKLFFNLRSMRPDTYQSLTDENIQEIADTLNVRPEDVIEMEKRLNNNEVSLESQTDDDSTDNYAPIHYLPDEDVSDPVEAIEQEHRHDLQTNGLQYALNQLDERSRDIVSSRWLSADGQVPTLHDLAAKYHVSAERIRQIESAALKKMRQFLSTYEEQQYRPKLLGYQPSEKAS
ncbi:RNA polymerase sigma factor RpoH [Basilea psittacipulmonis]|uniref:RNA polymerase sigma factor RpoH n=1 Tax=Basilea psittacipulmonis TaxID=1472345 RepID=UPI0009843191|nr:RNA polymerase sigma factor RpoH [Basilea psittacipulmonis]